MDQALIESASKVIASIGLPALFCLWLMFRVEKRLDEQTSVLRETAAAMAAVLEHLRQEK